MFPLGNHRTGYLNSLKQDFAKIVLVVKLVAEYYFLSLLNFGHLDCVQNLGCC